MFGLGLQELVVIFLIIFLLFGAKRLPEIANSLGRAIREFKKSAKEDPKDPPEEHKSDPK